MSLPELRKALKEKKLKIGIEESMKLLKKNKAREVFTASNCPDLLKNIIKKHCEISGCKFNGLKVDSKELGVICKKPFSISVCCYEK